MNIVKDKVLWDDNEEYVHCLIIKYKKIYYILNILIKGAGAGLNSSLNKPNSLPTFISLKRILCEYWVCVRISTDGSSL